MYWIVLHRGNYEALLHYYRHVATDFAPGRKLWVKHGRIYYQEPSLARSRVLWENASPATLYIPFTFRD